MSTLQELTGQESGIVFYEDGTIIVTNWAYSCPNGGVPIVDFLGTNLIAFPEEKFNVVEEYHVDDIRDVLPGIKFNNDGEIMEFDADIAYDIHDDIMSLFGYEYEGDTDNYVKKTNEKPTPGKVYELSNNATIIAPHLWG